VTSVIENARLATVIIDPAMVASRARLPSAPMRSPVPGAARIGTVSSVSR
jgi:hypothetical protein